MAADDKRPPAQLAKAALLRLAQAQQEPTPENYARAYAQEAGTPLLRPGADTAAASSASSAGGSENWSQLIERVVRGIERGDKSWPIGRKKDGLQRVLANNRSDAQRLYGRLQQLVKSWDGESSSDEEVQTASQFMDEEGPSTQPGGFGATGMAPLLDIDTARGLSAGEWPTIGASLQATVRHAVNFPGGIGDELMRDLDSARLELQRDGATPERAAEIEALCRRARHLLDHRQHLFGELNQLCRELSASLVDLAEEDSWVQGQCEIMHAAISHGLGSRGVRSATELLAGTRERQQQLRVERAQARDVLKGVIQQMLTELSELGQHTDRFQDSVGRYADAIEKADSLESLAGTVREMVEESRSVRDLVKQTQVRLSTEHDRAAELSVKVEALEDELRKLSSEVQTDQLTQIANRRGLIKAFEQEQARSEREGGRIALALLDIDNFKKLNDTLGHAAGDEALKSLAKRVSDLLRPGDMVARYGGEEFVLLLPATPIEEAQQVLARLQRSLSASLFTHEAKEVFVTFSAGVTLYRAGETLEAALDRADVALYEAKHTGKNRACVAP
ncbi:MAG: diguanylate cyclase [Paucibacter sp.]|nr:diguanylate cyclase [Roseateles sp.]